MEKLLKKALQVCDQAEIFISDRKYNIIKIINSKLVNIDSIFSTGLSLRIIKDNILGFSSTRNLRNRDVLIQNALNSMKGKIKVKYDFPLTNDLEQNKTNNLIYEEFSTEILVDECKRISKIFSERCDGNDFIYLVSSIDNIRILNSKGTDLSDIQINYWLQHGLLYPNSITGIYRSFVENKFIKLPENKLNEIIDIYNRPRRTIKPSGKKLKVLFMPNGMRAFIMRIVSGINPENIYKKISPISNKFDKKIFSEKISIINDPNNANYPFYIWFDDEGIKTKFISIVENGVFKNTFFDLNYAKKFNKESTGNGFRSYGIDHIPFPVLKNITIKPGEKSLDEIIKSIDKGIILEMGLGAHSGNIPNGDFSIGVSSGFYVENGEILGRINNCLISGNIYNLLQNVIEVENNIHYCIGGIEKVLAILIDNVKVEF